MSTQFNAYSFYVPTRDQALCDFLEAQSNVSGSICMLLKAFVSNYSKDYPDVTTMDLHELLESMNIDESLLMNEKQKSKKTQISDDINMDDEYADEDDDPIDDYEDEEEDVATEVAIDIEDSDLDEHINDAIKTNQEELELEAEMAKSEAEKSKIESEPEPQIDEEITPHTEEEPDPQINDETDPQTEEESEPESESEPEIQKESEPETDPVSESEPEAEPEPEEESVETDRQIGGENYAKAVSIRDKYNETHESGNIATTDDILAMFGGE